MTNMLWNGSEEVGDVSSESVKDEGATCEDGAIGTDW
jgi:hypothetical protein